MSNRELLKCTRLSPSERASLIDHFVEDHISDGNVASVPNREIALYFIADLKIAFLESFSKT
jgi:hypothetical protein